MSKYYYHYTDENGIKGIKESMQINPSLNTTTDAALGPGVYFSQKPPQTSTQNLVSGNYGISNDSTPHQQRTQYYVRAPVNQIPVSSSYTDENRNVHVLSTTVPLDLTEVDVKFGERKRYK